MPFPCSGTVLFARLGDQALFLLNLGAVAVLLGILGGGLLFAAVRSRREQVQPPPAPVIPPAVSGVLRLSVYASCVRSPPPETERPPGLAQSAVWVAGPHYSAMADNDIRGFLDGRFKYGRNQVSQVHLRVGRRERSPFAGEWELFRILQRWDDIALPPRSRVTKAALEMDVEIGSKHTIDLFLYPVKKAWEPGQGGVSRNNGGPPARGEVWWNEARHGIQTWGLPGAGLASDTNPAADTPASALAAARYHPGDRTVVFESPALAAYASERASAGEPLLLLIKVADAQEDFRDRLLHLYSAEHGDSKNTARRPRLRLEWVSEAEVFQLERHVILEHGRTAFLPRLAAPGETVVAASFCPDDGCASPRVLIRGGKGDEISAWQEAAVPICGDWDWIEVTLDTFINPTPLGQPFQARIRDTWVKTAPPEEQHVPWEFISPTGNRHRIAAKYLGQFVWEVSFVPDEIGRWRYFWKENFTAIPSQSAVGTFDVIPGPEEDMLEKLRALTKRIESSGLSRNKRILQFGEELMRVERILMSYEKPERVFQDGGNGEAQDLLDRAREALSGVRPQGARLHLEGDEPTYTQRDPQKSQG